MSDQDEAQAQAFASIDKDLKTSERLLTFSLWLLVGGFVVFVVAAVVVFFLVLALF